MIKIQEKMKFELIVKRFFRIFRIFNVFGDTFIFIFKKIMKILVFSNL